MSDKLVYLTPGCFDKGGISRYTRYQIRAWREILGEGNVRVLSLLGPDSESIEEPFQADWHGGGVTSQTKVELSLRALQMALSELGPILHAGHMNFAGVARAIASLTGGKLLVNVYGLEVWTYPRWHSTLGLRHADEVISDCHWTAKYVEDHKLRPPGSTKVFWDCVDLEKFTPGAPAPEVLQRYGIPDPSTGFNLMSLGRMSPDASHKGFDRLFEMFRLVAAKAPQVRLIYAGRGGLIEVLKEKAAGAGLADRVFFTGMVHEDHLADVYRAAHLFSLISDRGIGRGEGIPLTPLEAAACAVPIFVGNHDGSQEAVEEGVNGHIFDPFDLDSQATSLLKIVTDRQLRDKMAIAARARIEAEFSYPTFVEKHRALLESWRRRAPSL